MNNTNTIGSYWDALNGMVTKVQDNFAGTTTPSVIKVHNIRLVQPVHRIANAAEIIAHLLAGGELEERSANENCLYKSLAFLHDWLAYDVTLMGYNDSVSLQNIERSVDECDRKHFMHFAYDDTCNAYPTPIVTDEVLTVSMPETVYIPITGAAQHALQYAEQFAVNGSELLQKTIEMIAFEYLIASMAFIVE